jgi:hypothetical protein
MIIRLTQKLAAKIKEAPASSLSRDPDLFADWTANLFTANRVQYIILVNSATLYSVIMFGRGVTDGGIFIDRALSALRDFMTDDDVPFFFHRFIVPQSTTVSFSKTGDRSLLGSINDLVACAKIHLGEYEDFPFVAAKRLNEMPMKFIGYQFPREEMMKRSATISA